MKARILCIIALAFLCASSGGSSDSARSTPARNVTVQVPGLMTAGRWAPAVTLKSGNVLLVGGFGSLGANVLASAEVYHPKTDTLTLLHSGKVLIPAGLLEGTPGVAYAALETAEVYTP